MEKVHKSYKDYSITDIWKKKVKKNLSVSLVFPTLNEEFTIESVINMTNDTFCINQTPIIDEIVILDGGSSDKTLEICNNLVSSGCKSLKIYNQHDLSLQIISSSKNGKGDALYKSLYVTTSDIIIWIDADIKNYDEKFVIGLLGPLIVDEVKFSKGYYRRPYLTSENEISKDKNVSGGRVTELCARPMFNALYPELKHIIQPLGGEYGGYRECLENLEFSSGYGVETMLLLKLNELYGSKSICQVDLGERIHRHQPLCNLTRMSFVIIQTFLKQLEVEHKIDLIKNKELFYLPNQQSEDKYSKVRKEGSLHDDVFLKQTLDEEFKIPMIKHEIYQKKFYPNSRCVTINFIRHGETNYNTDGIIQGHLDSYLTSNGNNQTENLKKFLNINSDDLIYSSDLLRCRQTCEILFGSNNNKIVNYTELLRERNMGKYQGVKSNKLLSENLLLMEQIEDGESLSELSERIDKFLNLITLKLHNSKVSNIYVITHSTFILNFYKNIFGKIPNIIPENTSVSSFDILISDKIDKVFLNHWNNKNVSSEKLELITTKIQQESINNVNFFT